MPLTDTTMIETRINSRHRDPVLNVSFPILSLSNVGASITAPLFANMLALSPETPYPVFSGARYAGARNKWSHDPHRNGHTFGIKQATRMYNPRLLSRCTALLPQCGQI